MQQKTIIIALLLLIGAVGLQAQVKVGVKAGTVYSGMTSKTEYKANILINQPEKTTMYGSGGIVAEYQFNKHAIENFSLLHAEIKYSRIGGMMLDSHDVTSNTTIDKDKFQLDYLELPLSYGYSLRLAENIRCTIRGGIYFGYGISGKRRIESEKSLGKSGEAGTNDPFNLFEVKSDGSMAQFAGYKRADGGLIGGIDVYYSYFFVSCDYQHGLLPMQEYNKAGKVMHRNLYFSLGVMF